MQIHFTINTARLCLLILAGAMVSLFMPAITPAGGNATTPEGDLYAVSYTGKREVIVVGERGKIFHSLDRGKSWKQVHAHTRASLFAVAFPDDANGWICGQEGTVLHSDNAGKSWKEQQSGISEHLFAIDFFDSSNGIAAGGNGAVICTVDGGKTWKNLILDENTNIYGVVMTGEREACIAGETGRIFIININDLHAEEIRTSLYNPDMMEGQTLFSLNKKNGKIYGAGIDSIIVHSSDNGRSWVKNTAPSVAQELYGIDLSGDAGWAVGSGGNLMQSVDGGKNWQIVKVPEKITENWLMSVRIAEHQGGNIRGIIVGQNGSIYHLRGNALVEIQ